MKSALSVSTRPACKDCDGVAVKGPALTGEPADHNIQNRRRP